MNRSGTIHVSFRRNGALSASRTMETNMRAFCAGLALLIVGGMAAAEAQPFFGGGYYRPYGPRYGYGPGYGYGYGYGYRRCFIRPTPFGPRRICRY